MKMSFCAELSEIQEKPEIEIETIIAMTETPLIVDDSIKTVEHNCQLQKARTEAEIGRTRVVPSSQRQQCVLRRKNVVVAVREIMHLRNARMVLNVGIQFISKKMTVFKQ